MIKSRVSQARRIRSNSENDFPDFKSTESKKMAVNNHRHTVDFSVSANSMLYWYFDMPPYGY